mgnify:FL=1
MMTFFLMMLSLGICKVKEDRKLLRFTHRFLSSLELLTFSDEFPLGVRVCSKYLLIVETSFFPNL